MLDAILFVPPDTESSDGVAGLAVDGSLTAQLLEHLGCSGQTITRLANRDVEDELLDAELPHGVGRLVGLRKLESHPVSCGSCWRCIPLCVLVR